ncbi:PQQ-dependent sugar dehydrogenase [Rhodocytophaga aerolata]|uniref:PQQ-dependent sugar dehydrogenase n=1 Tax=Rhodocytophaga aerolata TaxID=455078 RepID=A0ABT8RGK0_9BACT|nr:PQQ-dependent sugar dehydrogenase [Rhodocytophaga aerolata]MDO1451235.1 PQQ-dependent sugar dehydrogenase [Rhodocytophaga aerolata]
MSLQLQAQSFPPGFTKVLVASGITNPMAMAFAPDGRIFVVQQDGTIRIIKNGVVLATPFLQVNVNSRGERGISGIVLDPNFSSNQYVYVYYTIPDGSRNRVSRFKGNGDVVVSGSETVLLTLDPLSSSIIHYGGAMCFGLDGKLYIGVGDNAYSAHAQNLATYHGKLLRINPDGSVPAGNPFSGSAQKSRVWAYGLRNPFTLDVQPGTGKIFVNDVGEKTWEEINNATTGGKNFGWPTAEGPSTNPVFANPVYAYQHGAGDGVGCAITGGCFLIPPPQIIRQNTMGAIFSRITAMIGSICCPFRALQLRGCLLLTF